MINQSDTSKLEESTKQEAGEGYSGAPCSPSYRPFSNGCEFMDWHAYNCERCTKGPAPDLQGPNEDCDIENAFALASVCGGTINDEVIGDEENARNIAKRLGWNGSGSLPARCSEFVENAKAEARGE